MNRPERDDERLFNAIEAVLGSMNKRVDAGEMMKLIRRRYPSPVFFIESNAYMLRYAGLHKQDAFYFSMIPALTRRVGRESYGKKPRLDRLSLMAEYLKNLFIGVHVECLYVVLLDSRGGMIRTVLVRRGITDTTPFDLKQMLSYAVQYEAKAFVICHNHPGGTLKPSKEDIACTLAALSATMSLGTPILDHIIIAHGRAASIRDLGYIPAALWTAQAPKMKLLREWVDVDLTEQAAQDMEEKRHS